MFIGIDLGTSSVKMIIVDHDQNILATADSPVSVQNPKDGYSEQNPEEWINATPVSYTHLTLPTILRV